MKEKALSLLQEFKEFAVKGNAVDMAVGIIIGAAFGQVVNSMVNDLFMPPLGYLIHGVDFGDLSFVLRKATATSPVVSINYGAFINKILNFTVVSACVFAMVKAMNSLKKGTPGHPTKKICTDCAMEIPIKARRCPYCTQTV